MTVQYLTEEAYIRNAEANPGAHWNNYQRRWNYHKRATEVAQSIGITSPEKVLEVGTMGASLVVASHTMDYAASIWDFKGKHPTYFHDARKTPWPIEDNSYELFIALRVFQHLYPFQEQAFLEAKRVSSKQLIVVPQIYDANKGVTYEMLLKWNNGSRPRLVERVYDDDTFLYVFE